MAMSGNMRIFVTGGNGMVGRNLVEALEDAGGCEVLAPSRQELDLLDAAAVQDFVDTARPDAIVHCAGRVGGIQANLASPTAFLHDNITMGLNVLQAARRAETAKVVNLSSSCMYPREAENPLREDAILTGPLEPTNEGYALAKIAVMRMGQYINREVGREQVKTLIPCNLYGRYDSFDPAKSHLVPAILVKLHQAKQQGHGEVEIWGTGEARREFMYAGDCADAIVEAVDRFETLPELMNVGIGSDHTVNEYCATAAKIVGWEGDFVHDTDRPVGMARKLCSTERQEAWGWKSSHTLEQGLAKTYRFYLGTLEQ